MKRKLIYIFLGLACTAGSMTMTSCESQLGALPENAKVDGNTVLDAATARIALNGVYYRFANVSTSKNITEWTNNERLPAQLAGYMIYGYGTGAGSPEDNQMVSSADTYWLYSYGIINAANSLIGGMDKLPQGRIPAAEREPIEAEARFLRAYGHFKLLSFYAQWFDYSSPYGVLLRDQPVTISTIPKARSTVAESYTSILADLDYAIAHCPAQNEKHYATSWAAQALKARVLLCRGQAGDYAEVIKLADAIINEGPYKLEARAEDIFRTKGASSTEVLLSITPQPNQPAYAYSRSRQFYPGASTLYCATTALRDLLAGDPRQDWMIGSFRKNYGNYFFTKYIAEATSPTVISETFYAIRLTEIYLMKAEALLRSNSSIAQAKAILKDIGSRNGLSDFSGLEALTSREDLLRYHYTELSKCLVAEDGQEWLCLLRLPLATITTIRPKLISKEQYILPVPRGEFVDNPKFGAQNPGYNIDL
ncbi:RagB/SusD family nutrient uptake outer membrane protein [Sphingobacterium thalpophilum]|uniref:SusD family n=1 Tax=Sphingobacterium thalpophilum TaxID=259 RepID=A0A4U9VKA2_9SPHI|nr:RagB/SusD family nutrient uptake outer membrane protein [Sphingobacterium thalpophilum]VTR43794.1 SusD family [Sphingobacterium thalpophilum]